MSKLSFSKKMSDTLYKKIRSFLYLDPNNFFVYDEYFELALCISYLTLSKETIIDKDIANPNRLGRLHRKVDTSEIEKLFDPSFCSETPQIINSLEADKTWILDNIRDSIMHGEFDVDEENKCFKINNTHTGRELEAIIPFSWFIAYTKNNIVSRIIKDQYTFGGFYYNREKKPLMILKTNDEIIRNIMYKVHITSTNGEKFNVEEISKRIRELLDEMSKKPISDALVEQYKKNFHHRFAYSDRYLASFAIACEYTKETVEKEYPGINVRILLEDKKHKFMNSVRHRLPRTYRSYDVLIKELNFMKRRKEFELLSYIQKLLINFEYTDFEGKIPYTPNQFFPTDETILQFADRFDGIVGDDLMHLDNVNRLNVVRDLLLNILINVYGITTLVINHGDFYNNEFLNSSPSLLGIEASIKQPIIKYYSNQRACLNRLLKRKIELCKLQIEYNENPSKNKKKDIKRREEEIKEDEQKFKKPSPDRVVTDKSHKYYTERDELMAKFNRHLNDFNRTNDPEAKERIKEVIMGIYDKIIDNELNNTSAITNNMEEILKVIRNCFSHIGRIHLGRTSKGLDVSVFLHDYDTKGKESGNVYMKLGSLIELLRRPFDKQYATDDEMKL